MLCIRRTLFFKVSTTELESEYGDEYYFSYEDTYKCRKCGKTEKRERREDDVREY